MSPRILASVVTYNPDVELERNLRAIADQASALIVIDNASKNIAEVAAAVERVGGRLIRNDRNLGIATALNQAVEVAQAEGFEWLATYDQDSLPPPGMIDGLIEVRASHPDGDRIGLLAPSHRDRVLHRDYAQPGGILGQGETWRVLRTTITSGNLIPVSTFERVGAFNDGYFIDAVDHEFCLRCRREGLLVVEGVREVLEHQIGSPKIRTFLGLKLGFANHTPTRRYYITRNHLYTGFRYFWVDTMWSIGFLARLGIQTTVALTLEDHRRQKAAAIWDGLSDFVRGRLGPRPSKA